MKHKPFNLKAANLASAFLHGTGKAMLMVIQQEMLSRQSPAFRTELQELMLKHCANDVQRKTINDLFK